LDTGPGVDERYPVTTRLNETNRVEAFSDGVFAIAITLLILEIKLPRDLVPRRPSHRRLHISGRRTSRS
jgi:Endosomal/lysosomal potassium channel TMEM175